MRPTTSPTVWRAITRMAFVALTAVVFGAPLALSDSPNAHHEMPKAGWGSGREALLDTPHGGSPDHAAALQSKCCSCGGSFPREVARLCSSCSSKYRSKCCLCNGSFPKDAARLCSSCSSRFRTKCFLCSGSFPKDVARLCSSCTSKY